MTAEMHSTPPPSRVTTELTQSFWDGLAQGRFLVQLCVECGRHQFYPGPICRRCWASDLSWVEPTRLGTVRSFTIAYVPTHPHWTAAVPYVIALVELNEGPCLTTNIVGCLPGDVRVGQGVEARITADSAGQPLLQFAISDVLAGVR